MEKFYSAERNVQILVALLKAHMIRYVIASPGTTNINFVASVQCDPWFKVFSSVDERSAAYMACGIASETGEPVVLSCTGATASRNYVSGMTEAYYRKLPVLAVTSTQNPVRVGHLVPQVIDRSAQQADTMLLSIMLNTVATPDQEWDCEIKVNRALLELRHRGGGPVHINLETTYANDFTLRSLPPARFIDRLMPGDELPPLPQGRIGVFVGAHQPFSAELEAAVDRFCALHDAVVFCDHTSGYNGKFAFHHALVVSQLNLSKSDIAMELMIHIGEVSGDYSMDGLGVKEVWRVSEDGELRDRFKKLRHVFEMSELEFFTRYGAVDGEAPETTYIDFLRKLDADVRSKFPEIPFSNIWIASRSADLLPAGASLHLGILNTLRSWNLFALPQSVSGRCNVGGFGIDGDLSAMIGASLVNPAKLYFAVVGDLAFFYDMNVLGNRHVGDNVRIILINNGRGTEFHNYDHPAAAFGAGGDPFMAAAAHYGNQSRDLVRHYATDLGYRYFAASSKEDFLACRDEFFSPTVSQRMLLEVFTDSDDESDALRIVKNYYADAGGNIKILARKVLGNRVMSVLRRFLKK